MTAEEFSQFLNDQATRHYPDPDLLHILPWWHAEPHTFTIPLRTRERVVIPPGALVRVNPRLLRRLT